MKIYKSANSEIGPTWSLMDDNNNTLAICPRINPKNGLDVSEDEAERILNDAYTLHWDGVVQVELEGQEAVGLPERAAKKFDEAGIDKEIENGREMLSGCPECGVAYSFVFGVQLHSTDCKRA